MVKKAKAKSSKKETPRGSYVRAMEALRKDPGNHDKITEVCRLIPPAPPKKGGGK